LISEQDYSVLDRLTHRIAFLHPAVQLAAADVEETLYGSRFRDLEVDRPIFINSLPRAGTTLLLEILARHPELASHTYRDMPFVMAPILWSKLSGGGRRADDPKERAHGDGMQVGFDSPEAFEEVIWRAFWPKRYKGETIPLWEKPERVGEFRTVFGEQIQRVLALRGDGGSARKRYLSKNNANIARLGFLKEMFPGSILLIPFRDPVDHAASMLNQHKRFLNVHRNEPFSKRYMRDLGHFEFGDLHRPFDFPGVVESRNRFQPDGLDYWVGYWLLAFTHILQHADEVILLSYERLCGGGLSGVRRLGSRLGLEEEGSLQRSAENLRPPNAYDINLESLDPVQLDEARALHERLLELADV
jgi:hypothetical protein